jgi:uncharacterized membrane protein HdeD (DUF308 family)
MKNSKMNVVAGLLLMIAGALVMLLVAVALYQQLAEPRQPVPFIATMAVIYFTGLIHGVSLMISKFKNRNQQ